MRIFATYHRWKGHDGKKGRMTLGTAAHLERFCPRIRDRQDDVVSVEGQLAEWAWRDQPCEDCRRRDLVARQGTCACGEGIPGQFKGGVAHVARGACIIEDPARFIVKPNKPG